MNRVPLVLGIVLVSALAGGCGSGSGNPSSPSTPVPDQAVAKSLPPEYRTLAARLGQGLKPDTSDFRDDKSPSHIVAEGHGAVLDLRAIRSADADIDYIAAQGATAYAEAVARLERLNALPKPPGTGSLMVESFIHGLYGNPYAGYALGADASTKQKAILDELTGLVAAVEKADAAHLLLPRVAERYAAPVVANDGRVVIDFDESWNAWGPHDWCRFYNGGGDIEDCTVVVELKGAGGQVRRNVHFVNKWAGKSWLYARYDADIQVGNRRVGRMTVKDVSTVEARVLSPRYSTEVRYTYTGAEKTKDVTRFVEEVKPHIQFRVRDSVWGVGSGRVLVLENRWKHPVFQVGVRVVSAGGTPVGEFVKQRLDPGGSMDVGSLQVSRNLVAGDRVTVWLGEAQLLATTVR